MLAILEEVIEVEVDAVVVSSVEMVACSSFLNMTLDPRRSVDRALSPGLTMFISTS